MPVRAQETWRAAAPERRAAGTSEGAELPARDVLETLESSRSIDEDMAATRGFVNAAAIGAVVWTLLIVIYSMLS